MSLLDKLKSYISNDTKRDISDLDLYTSNEMDDSDYVVNLSKDRGKITEKNILGSRRVISQPAINEDELYAGNYPRGLMTNNDGVIHLGVDSVHNKVAGVEIDIDNYAHTALFGETGGGKSTMMKNMCLQLAEQGNGFCFFDPKADGDAEELVQKLPENRLDDVVYLKLPNDFDTSINFNPLSPEVVNDSTVEGRSELVSDLMGGLNGAIMEQIYDTISYSMIRSREDFTIIDIHAVTSNMSVLEKFDEYTDTELRDEFKSESVSKLVEKEEEEFQSLQRRLFGLVIKESIREIIATRENDISFKDLVNNDKILIVETDENEMGREIIGVLNGLIVNNLFEACGRSTTNDDYYVFADEFPNIIKNADISVGDIFRLGRSRKFHMVIASQDIGSVKKSASSQDDNVDAMINNLKTPISYAVGNKASSGVADMFTSTESVEITGKQLEALPDFTAYLEIPSENESRAPPRIDAFPPFPPRRTIKDAKQVIRQSNKRYGSENVNYNSVSETVHPILSGKDVVNNSDIIEAVDLATRYDKANKTDIPDGYASRDTIDLILKEFPYVNIDEINIDEMFESIITREKSDTAKNYIETTRHNSEIIYSLNGQGDDELSSIRSSGESVTGGSDYHRLMVQELPLLLAPHGIGVTVPSQGSGEEMPDARGFVFEDSESRPFKNQLDVGSQFPIEVEKETMTSKKQRGIKNLRKAFNDDSFVLFVGDDKKIGDNIENIMSEPSFRTLSNIRFSERGSKYYNGDALKTDDYLPLRSTKNKSDKQDRWYSAPDGRVLLIHQDNTGTSVVTTSYDKPEDFADWKPDDFDAVAEKHDGMWVIDGKEYRKPSEINSADIPYRHIKKPFIPEVEFENGVPSENDYGVLIISENDEEPLLYSNGTMDLISEATDEDIQNMTDDDSTDDTENDTTDDTENDNMTEDDDFKSLF